MYAVRFHTAWPFGTSWNVAIRHSLSGNCAIGPRLTGFFDCFRKGGTIARKIGGTVTNTPISAPRPSVTAPRKPERDDFGGPSVRFAAAGGPFGGGAGAFSGRLATGWPERSLSQRNPKTSAIPPPMATIHQLTT